MKRNFFLLMAVGCCLTGLVSFAASPQLQKQSDGVTLKLPHGILKLRVCSPRIVEVVYTPGNSVPKKDSLSVIGHPVPTNWKLTESSDEISLRTDELIVRVNRETGAAAFLDKNGQPILRETADGGKTLTPNRVGDIQTFRSQASFEMAPGEAYFGLGQHQQGFMNYRGETIHLQQRNPTESAVPVMLSSRGYGIFWDNPAVTDVSFGGAEGEVVPSAQLLDANGQPGGLTAHYFRGENFDESVRTNVDAEVAFDWTAKAPPGLNHDHYSVRWTGYVLTKESGDYTFLATADDGVRLWIDDQEVINDWNVRPAQTFTAKVHLEANSRHRIRMEYFQAGGEATVRLAWQVPNPGKIMTWNSEAADAVDYYFMYGPELDQVIGDYRELTGAVPMMGKWAWGFWQCKERYQSQAELLDVVARYRGMHVPIDGIIQDWQYWSPHPWGSHEFDTNRYPDPAALMHDLHTNHIHALISVWPKFDVGSSNWAELNKAGCLYSNVISHQDPSFETQWYDPFNPLARKIYWDQISREIFADGFDGWWLDASEPELSGNWGEFYNYKTAAGPAAKVFNAYPLEHTRGVYEGQRAENSNKRVFILTRSAYAGQQRNSAVTWSGDINGTWDVFARQIPAGLNFVASGIPYWNTDTGGFFGGDPADANYCELFTRWFQFSAFCPMFRVHGTGKPKEMWRFNEATQKILINYDKLRYHLLPYIYSVSWMVTHDSYTMMRPLVMDFRADPNVFGIKDQFMFGPALMACPVTEPGATNRNVYLPAGTWFNFWTGEKISGGQTIKTASPIQTMPLFVRAGSIIPYGPAIEYAAQSANPIELRVYRGANGRFTLYEDEGDNYNYERGAYATIPFIWNEAKQTLTIGKREGKFPGMLKERSFHIVFVSIGHGSGNANTDSIDRTVSYSGGAIDVVCQQDNSRR
jgi:alpha-D-xyloside xylohydrolase